jgi:hypothetical protein
VLLGICVGRMLLTSSLNSDLPPMDRRDMIILEELRKKAPLAFYSNITKFFFSEMYNYIKDSRCYRCSIMGETRGGKSECGQTLALVYVSMFNTLLDSGNFDNSDLFKTGVFEKSRIVLDIKKICSNQSDYIYRLRDEYKDQSLKFGQVWIIDESKKAIGGLGSYSETLDLENINNIIAKFMQSEIWIQPLQFETKNAPYGLYVYKKDVKARVNWCLCYRMQRTATGGVEYTFMGWVKLPLHTNEELRRVYNIKKNEWIEAEMSGSYDVRLEERKSLSKRLSEDKEFSRRTASGKAFRLSKAQQVTVLEDWILSGKTQNWNQMEREMIVEEARRVADGRHYDEEERLQTEEGEAEDTEE